MTAAPAVVVAGDAFVDMISGTSTAGRLCYEVHPGGSCLNVAVGLARLGVPTALLARLSTDVFGAVIRRALTDSGVLDTYLLSCDDPTCLAMAHLQGTSATYSFLSHGAADRSLAPEHLDSLAELPSGAALHVGSVALVQEPQASTLDGLIRREAGRRVITLDPNVRPGLIADRADYLARLSAWVGMADIVKASDEDIAWIGGGRPAEEVVGEWLEAGARLVLVTLGGRGAWASTGRDTVRAPAPPVEVVDTVGAGDAFMSATLAFLVEEGLLTGDALAGLGREELERLLAHAVANAADTCTRAGADPPWAAGPAVTTRGR